MLDFKPLTPEVMVEIKPLLQQQRFRSCDYTVGGLFMWRDYFNETYTVVDDMLICRVDYLDLGHCYTFPVGSGDLNSALLAIGEDAQATDSPLRFCCVVENAISRLTDMFGQAAEIFEFRDWADYLYPHEAFCTYSGKKLVTQRNHCNRFRRDFPDFTYEPVSTANIGRVLDFLLANEDHFKKPAPLSIEEYKRALEVLDYFDEFGFVGGILSVGDKPVGITVGEIVDDTLHVHIEKALVEYSGSYPMLASLFANQTRLSGVKYINREDDSGDEGLRRSKLMYRPAYLINKYVVSFIK